MVCVIDMECSIPRHATSEAESTPATAESGRRWQCDSWCGVGAACRLRHGKLRAHLGFQIVSAKFYTVGQLS
jgi:hypothetical protein